MKIRKLILAGLFGMTLTAAHAEPAAVQATAQPVAATVAEPQANCLQETGSRLKPKDGKCISAPGTVVSREELDRSGAINVGDALRRAVPSIY